MVATSTVCQNGSVHHAVLFTLKKDQVEMEKVRSLVDGCLRSVPGLIELHVGEEQPKLFDTKVDRSQGATHVLVSRHVNAEALKIYATHPEHIKLAKYLMSHAAAPPVVGDIFSCSKL